VRIKGEIRRMGWSNKKLKRREATQSEEIDMIKRQRRKEIKQ
jgi:hypothetical protein